MRCIWARPRKFCPPCFCLEAPHGRLNQPAGHRVVGGQIGETGVWRSAGNRAWLQRTRLRCVIIGREVIFLALTINSNAIDAFNRKAEVLLNHVVKNTQDIQTSPAGSFVPDFHTYNIPAEDIIGGVTMSLTDVDGVKISQFVSAGGEKVGLEGDGYRSLRLLAEEIYKRTEVNSCLSFSGVESVLFQWVIARHSGKTSDAMMAYCLPILEATIIKLFVWVPIFGIATEFSFDLGRTKVYQMQKQFFDTWEASFVVNPSLDRANYQPRIDGFRRRFQGWAACTMQIEAEPKRAYEIAMEEAENALALLRVCLPTNLHPSVPSFCRPVGKEGIEKGLVISIHGNLPPMWSEDTSSSFRPWTLNKALMDTIISSGLGELHRLYLSDNKSEFQRELLKSVMTYSRSSLKAEASDRLIYIFTALDSFLLQNQSENIQQNIAERIAFTISDDASERQKIKKNVIAAYGMRSQAVHHNQGIENREILIEFLRNVFRFYILMVSRNRNYKTRQDFFNDVDLKKFS